MSDEIKKEEEKPKEISQVEEKPKENNIEIKEEAKKEENQKIEESQPKNGTIPSSCAPLRRSARAPRPLGADGHQARPKTAPHKVGWEHPLRLSLKGEIKQGSNSWWSCFFYIPRLF